MQSQRPYKIDLVISRRHKEHQTTARHQQEHHQSEQLFKKGKRARRIALTLGQVTRKDEHKMNTNPQNHKTGGPHIDISEFKIDSTDQQPPMVEVRHGEGQILKSIVQNQTTEIGKQWWQYLRNNNCQYSRQKLMDQLISTQKKIKFFHDLVQQKQEKFCYQKQEKKERQQECIKNLQKMYRSSLDEADKIYQKMEQINQEDYHDLRKRINQDGKYGLNYSPKQMSVFSGASDTILLSKGSSYEASIRRGENFSFGSIKKNQVRAQSANRSIAPFLNPGRACLAVRKLNYNQL